MPAAAPHQTRGAAPAALQPIKPIDLRRLPILLRADPSRVLIRPFLPAGKPVDAHRSDTSRIERFTDRVLAMKPAAVQDELDEVMREFGSRHAGLHDIFMAHFELACDIMQDAPSVPDRARQLLIGAYFSHEYSFEAAALFNPSIVRHPDQDGLSTGEVRFVLSLRGTGEGHISSICFRSGVVDASGDVRLDPPSHRATMPRLEGAPLPDGRCDASFDRDTLLAERVIFPITQKQRNGLEDARFVRFIEDDGSVTYYATYTAYNGQEITPELLRTDDFRQFIFLPMRGEAVCNKGMALFPRRIGGRYAMLTRLNGESLQLSWSDDVQVWNGAVDILGPVEPWEFMQIGNCGSPIELPEGWLVLTHGVGSMRRYCLGAALLDLHDPSRVLARLQAPLLIANEQEREGYVPNVVYSCGGIMHGGDLILPYAVSDSATSFAVVSIRSVLAVMSWIGPETV